MTMNLKVEKLKVARYRLSAPGPRVAAAPVVPNRMAMAAEGDTVQAVTAPPQAPMPQAPMPKAQAPKALVPDDAFQPDGSEDGFGDQSFLPPKADADAATDGAGTEIDTIRKEGLTGRQLRIARRMAQKHNLPATSDFDAVRLLRAAGIDPFGRSAVLELVEGDADGSTALTVPDEANRLPQTVKPAAPPAPRPTDQRAEDSHLAEVRRIQADLVRRRRRKFMVLWAKLAVFVFLPTLVAGWYFFVVATPMYTAKSSFVIQQSTATASVAGLFSGTSFATSQDSVAVQKFLQSNDAMQRLDRDLGFRAHFSDPAVDPLQRLEPDATNSAAFDVYSKFVRVSYDPTEGLINMEVSAASPAAAVDFSSALIGYAEERVDQLSATLRGDQEDSAAAAFADATEKLRESQRNLVELQTKYKTLSSEVEAGLVTSQIAALDTQLTQERLALAQMEANAAPNQARLAPVKSRIATLESEIARLRSGLTETAGAGPSLATVQSDLAIAQAEVATRQMMLAQATTAMETSRIEAARKTRYLELAVRPVAPDTPSYPKAFEDTLVVMLIFLGLYLMVSMTVAILREQVSG